MPVFSTRVFSTRVFSTWVFSIRVFSSLLTTSLLPNIKSLFTAALLIISLFTALVPTPALAQVALSKPAFLASTQVSEHAANAFSFLEQEAGIALYTQQDSFDLARLRRHYRVLEADTPDYLLGSVAVPGYEAYENYDAYVYARADGWLVVYYPDYFFTAFAIDWLAYDARQAQLGAQAAAATTLPTKLEQVAALFGVRFGASEQSVHFYDFRWPEADNLLLMVDHGETGQLEFFYELPQGFQALDMTFSQAAHGHCDNLLYVNEQVIFALPIPEEHTDNLPASAKETGYLHRVRSVNRDPNCLAAAHAGVAITSRAGTSRAGPQQVHTTDTSGLAQAARVRMRSAESSRNIPLRPLVPTVTPQASTSDPQSRPTLQLIAPLAGSRWQGPELVVRVFVQRPRGHDVRVDARANGTLLTTSRNLAAHPARGDELELRYMLPSDLQPGSVLNIELVAVNTTTGAMSDPLVFELVYASRETAARFALVMGNSQYQHTLSLRNPTNDAQAIAEVLSQAEFNVTLHNNLSLSEMLAAVDNFQASLPQHATALVYYSGHGLQLDSENYLIPVDARIAQTSDIAPSSYALTELLASLARAQTGLNIIILDACRDNPFNMTSPPTSGLAAVSAPPETYIAYATAANAVASDGTGLHSPFTQSLLEVIPTAGLTLDAVFAEVGLRVEAATEQRQIPWIANNLRQEFVFTPPSSTP
ncbi:MAG: caspase family protein [Deinococcota bacterium]